MTDKALHTDVHAHDAHGHGHHDPASKVIFGFWIFILTDCVLFAAQFATYSVLHNNTYGNIGIAELTQLPWVLVQTLLLLASCATYGLSLNGLQKGDLRKTQWWLLVTFLMGLVFVVRTFFQLDMLYVAGHGWQDSAFLSAFFSLVGTHWVHLCVGLLWMVILLIQFNMKKITPTMKTRLICLGLFWNFLNLIWVCIFTLVYLMGAI
jgi:cytochrome o ubiquinol oxidase subunit 3